MAACAELQRAVTELKGTTCITHHFEASAPPMPLDVSERAPNKAAPAYARA